MEHKTGWRCQYAYPKSFVLPLEMMPVSMARLEQQMAVLAAYGCDISLMRKQQMLPLWAKDSGYNVSGFNLLIQRCQGW